MQAVVIGALHGDAGADDLCQAINIVGLQSHLLLDLLTHALGRGLRTEEAGLQLCVLAKIHPHRRRLFGQHQRVGGSGIEDGGAKVFHDLDLPPGKPAGDGDHRRSNLLRADVESQAAGK